MPKRVDHDQRRRDIAAAVWHIAAAEGLEAVSMRHVARQAGISAPLLQRYFPEKHELLRHAMTELNATAEARSHERVTAALPDPTTPGFTHTLLHAILAEFLPFDAQRREFLLVHMAYFPRALTDPTLDSVYRDSSPPVIATITTHLRTAQDDGQARADFDAPMEADTLVTLCVGLGTEMLIGIRTPESATAVIDYHLTRLLL